MKANTERVNLLTHNESIKNFIASPSLALASAIFGIIIYLIQAMNFAHMQISLLDEGAYLYKGYLFATGQYTPFQEYGPWGNHMPLSFLVPGYIQRWFGPGLRTGRYFSIALGLLLLLGLWLLANRFGGKWWAAGAIWAMAVNPMGIKVYSLAVSQILVACMLIWVMVLILNERASLWQIGFGSILAGLLIITRLNMVLVLPLLILFILWQHGFKASITATIAGGLALVIGHAFFWPGIMRLWASWLPFPLKSFLNTWRGGDIGTGIWNPQISLDKRWLSFWQGIRYNFLPMVGIIGFGLFGFQRKYWKSAYYQRVAVFLSLLIALMVAAHAWASLWHNYCVFCFSGYLPFFSPLALLLIIVVLCGWEGKKSIGLGVFAIVLVLIISAGIGYASYQEIGPWLIELPIPRIKGGRFVGGFAPIWGVLEGALGLQNQTAKALLSIMGGLAAGAILLLLTWVINRRRQAQARERIGLGMLALTILLVVGLIFSPTTVLGGGYAENDCSGDVIAAQEAAGRHLAAKIPPGSQVYWDGSLSVVPLLYAPGVNIYLPQINDGYAFRQGGNEDDLLKLGLWNIQLANQWRLEADFIIIEEERYNQGWKSFLESGEFVEWSRSPTTDPCQENAGLRIFRRISQ